MGVETVAAIAAVASLAGTAMSSRQASKNRPKPTKTVENPNFDAHMQRYLATIDKYMEKRGIKPANYGQGGAGAAAPQAPAQQAPAPQVSQPSQVPQLSPPPQVALQAAPPSNAQTVPINRVTRATGAPATPTIVSATSSPTPTTTDNSSAYAAGISAVGQIGGQLIANSMNKPSSGAQPTKANPYYDQMQSRYQGIIDSTLNKNGIDTSALPAFKSAQFPTSAPAQTLPSSSASALPTASKGSDIGQTRANRANFVGAINAATQNQRQQPAPIAEENYNNAAFAAKVGARRLGMSEDPKLETTRDFHEQDQMAKQEELNKLYNYIYGQSSVRV